MFFKDKKEFKNGFFTFHIVDLSPWPLLTSLASFCLMIGMMDIFYFKTYLNFFISLFYMIFCFFGWQKNILKESLLEGNHTLKVQKGLKMGMVFFILSEILFFFSFFWSLFYFKISPSILLGEWPPTGVQFLDPLSVPLLGTLILMSSGVSITWSHYSVLENKWFSSFLSLFITIFLGFLFSKFQLMEYKNSSFTMSDSVYGSIFFLMTGFHGFHVLIGSIFLSVCLFRLLKFSFNYSHHVGFESAIWYWHFVDVVWLFLFFFLYF